MGQKRKTGRGSWEHEPARATGLKVRKPLENQVAGAPRRQPKKSGSCPKSKQSPVGGRGGEGE